MGDEWCGAVLTGGRSTRMGSDKALYLVDGDPMALRVARALRSAGAAEIVCVGGDATALGALGLETIDDLHPDDGPLGAFITALHWSSSPITLVTPCDLLTPEPASFTALVTALRESDVDAAVPIVDGAWRSMPAAIRTSAVTALDEAFAAGARAAHAGISALSSVSVDAGPLGDADTPEEVERRQ